MHGDLGRSIRTHQPVGETILARLPVTVELGLPSMVVALTIGLPTGVFAALHRNSRTRRGEFECCCLRHCAAQFRRGPAAHRHLSRVEDDHVSEIAGRRCPAATKSDVVHDAVNPAASWAARSSRGGYWKRH